MNSAFGTNQPAVRSSSVRASGMESLRRVVKQSPEKGPNFQERTPGVVSLSGKALAPKPKSPGTGRQKPPPTTPQATPPLSLRNSMVHPFIPGARGLQSKGLNGSSKSMVSSTSSRWAWTEDDSQADTLAGPKRDARKRLRSAGTSTSVSSGHEDKSKVHENAQAVERVWWSGWFDFLPVALISWLFAFSLIFLPFLLNFWFVLRSQGHSSVQRIAGSITRDLRSEASGFNFKELQIALDTARAEDAAFVNFAEGRECVHNWTALFQSELQAANRTLSKPDVVRTALSRLFGAEWWPAFWRLDAILSSDADLVEFAGRIGSCAAENMVLGRIACLAWRDPDMRLRYGGEADFGEALSETLTYMMAVEALVSAAAADAVFAQEMVRRINERLEHAEPAADERDKHEAARAGLEWAMEAIRTREVDAKQLEAYVQLGVLQEALEALQSGPRDAGLAGLALAVQVEGRGSRASVSADEALKLAVPLGKEWADVLVAWTAVLAADQPAEAGARLGLRAGQGWVPSLVCASQSVGGADLPYKRMLARFIDSSYLQGGHTPAVLRTESSGAAVAEGWAEVVYRSLPWQLPQQGNLTQMADDLHRAFRPTGWSLFSFIATDDIPFVSTISLLAACLLAATALESIMALVVLPLLHQEAADSAAWMTEMLYSLFVLVALYAQSPWGIPFMIVGTWRAGIPECLSGFLCALDPLAPNTLLQRVHMLVRAVSMGLHHTTTAFVICAISIGYSSLNRDVLAVCLPMAYLHLAAPLRYQSQTGYLILVVLIEVWWQFEAFYFLGNAHPLHERVALCIMLAAHYCIIVADGIDAMGALFVFLCSPRPSTSLSADSLGDDDGEKA